MFYKFLVSFEEHVSFLNVFKYITFRTLLAILTSFSVSVIFGDRVIQALKCRQKGGQPIRELGPENHFSKKGTPTMGGVLIILAIILSAVLWADLANVYILVSLFVFLSFGLLGFVDDYQKVSKRNTKGVAGKVKLLWQFTTAAIATVIIILYEGSPHSTVLTVPIFKHFMLNLGLFYILFSMLVITGASNAVNLTDGLDALVIGPIIIAAACFGFIAYATGNTVIAEYLHLVKVPESSELAVLMGAVVGAGLGFLWFNCPPAQIFMGDVGSLALGGLLGIVAVITKHEILLAIIGGLFVIEALSVIIQVFSFKTRGVRVFKMAPIHHHFEKQGWPETKVVFRFWIVAIIFAIIGISTLKIR
jgi:phospho-N-acetylmuramoyl-pentapeptide-transferase